jgi:hypothetical protein
MNGAELLVSALENEGVKQIFGIPGEENLDVVEALRRSSIRLVLTGFPDFGMAFGNPDFVAYAKAHAPGAAGWRT